MPQKYLSCLAAFVAFYISSNVSFVHFMTNCTICTLCCILSHQICPDDECLYLPTFPSSEKFPSLQRRGRNRPWILAGNHSPLEGESPKPSRQAPAEAVGGSGAPSPLAPSPAPSLTLTFILSHQGRGEEIHVRRALGVVTARLDSRAGGLPLPGECLPGSG